MSITIRSMDELKDCFFEMLCVFDEFCITHGIEYWLWAGTLIGSVREKNFIEWDDDVDVIMTRDSYEKLKATANQVPEGYGISFPGGEYFYDFITEFVSYNHLVKRAKSKRNPLRENAFVNPMIDIYILDRCCSTISHKMRVSHLLMLYGLARGHREYEIPTDVGHKHNVK